MNNEKTQVVQNILCGAFTGCHRLVYIFCATVIILRNNV